MSRDHEELDERGTLRLRSALPDDAAAIALLHVASWQAAYRGLLEDELLDSLDLADWTDRRRNMLASPKSPETRNWVLEDEAGVFGWASAGPAREETLRETANEIYALYLDPRRIAQGHGHALMDHCLQDARARGFKQMVLWVLEGNARADRFYRAAGFQPDRRAPPKAFRETGRTQVRLFRELD